MRRFSTLTSLLILALCINVMATTHLPDAQDADDMSVASLTMLEQKAKARVNAKSRVPLAAENADIFKEIESLDANG